MHCRAGHREAGSRGRPARHPGLILKGGARFAREEVNVNSSGGPERDETGLPRIDVDIPEDARELDRDVQAYHRELRAERRRMRSRRLHLTLARDGMVMPLLICCLIFALITGTLLTLFTATSIDQSDLPGGHGRSAQPGTGNPPPTAGSTPTAAPPQLEAAIVGVAGKPVALQAIGGPAILLVVPPRCGCYPVVREVASLATTAHEGIYLVVAPADINAAERLVSQLGNGLHPVTDVTGALTGPDYYIHTGLTAIAVTRGGMVTYEDQLQGAGANLNGLVDSI
jgi:hypothetical protein